MKIEMTEQEIDNLMKPRIVCIADYPNNKYTVGEEVPMIWDDKFNSWSVKHETLLFPSYFSKFKRLFREYRWYERRDIFEMPEYVRWLDGKAYKVIEHDCSADGHQGYGDFFTCKVEGHEKTFLQYANCLPTNKDAYIPKF